MHRQSAINHFRILVNEELHIFFLLSRRIPSCYDKPQGFIISVEQKCLLIYLIILIFSYALTLKEWHLRCHFWSFCWNLQSGGLSLSFIKAWRVNSDLVLHESINVFPEQRSLFSVSPQAEWDLMNHQAQHLVECDKHVALSVVLMMWKNIWAMTLRKLLSGLFTEFCCLVV